MLPDSSTSVTHREEWLGPENFLRKFCFILSQYLKCLSGSAVIKKIAQGGCTHFLVISNGKNNVNVKITSIGQQIVSIMAQKLFDYLKLKNCLKASHRQLNRGANAHYRHTAFIKNSMTQALSYFVAPSSQIQSNNPQVICWILHVKVVWSESYGVYNNRKGAAKAIKKLIYACRQKKLVRRIQYMGMYLSVKRVSLKRQSQAVNVR